MSLAKVLRKAFRITDILLHQSSSGRFILVSPETSADQAKQMIVRLTAIAKEELNITPQFGFATFPEDAYTFEELLSHAENNYEFNIPEVKAEI
jgi:GGDEF domain-containing protein